jgi:ubiquitin carboxyl-terminal hydrolase L5
MAKQTSREPKAGSDAKKDVQEQTHEQAMFDKDSANSATSIEPEIKEDVLGSSAEILTDGCTSSTMPQKKGKKAPLSTKKRGVPESSPESERSSKKSKDSPPSSPPQNAISTSVPTFPSAPNMPATTHDKETWQGFCDIESDPAYFSVILRDMGVQGVTVREVFAMDPSYVLAEIPQPIYGFILLFHYREFGTEDQALERPKDVWFANQLPAQNSCATLAMINILMNSVDVGIGEHLDQFKDFTRDFSSYQRGEALASFDFVKKIHNSFAKKMDILAGDKYLSSKAKRAERLKAQLAETTKFGKGKGTKSRGRRESVETVSSTESVGEAGHHYIAFVPVGNSVWKLDGFDAQPALMGSFDAECGETWLSSVTDTIATLMAAGDDDYGVIALAQSPLVSLRKKACLTINTLTHVESCLKAQNNDWRSFTFSSEQPLSPRMLGLQDYLESNPVPSSLQTTINVEDMPVLLGRRRALIDEGNTLAAQIMTEIQNEAEENEKAMLRQYDGGPVIKKWLEMLAENGHLEQNLAMFMNGKK